MYQIHHITKATYLRKAYMLHQIETRNDFSSINLGTFIWLQTTLKKT